MSIVKGGGSIASPGAGPPGWIDNWYYPTSAAIMDPGAKTLTTTTTRLYYIPFFVFNTHTFVNMAAYNSGTGDSGDILRLGIYSHHKDYGPRTLKKDWGAVTLDGSSKKLEPSSASTASLTMGWWWLAVHCSGNPILYAQKALADGYGFMRGQAEFGVPAVDAATLDDINQFPYVDTAYAAFATTAVAPTTSTSVVPKVWLKA